MATARPINDETIPSSHASSENTPSIPPPIPPRPVGMKLNVNRILSDTKTNNSQRLQHNLSPSLHNHKVTSNSQQLSTVSSTPLSSISLNEDLNNSFSKNTFQIFINILFFLAQLSITTSDLHANTLHNSINNYLTNENENIRYAILYHIRFENE